MNKINESAIRLLYGRGVPIETIATNLHVAVAKVKKVLRERD